MVVIVVGVGCGLHPRYRNHPAVLADVIDDLACPHCGGTLSLAPGALTCAAGHSFDIARQGYVNLLPGDARTGTADTAEMVAARAGFLAAGHYDPLAEAVGEAAEAAAAGPGPVIELGAGTAHHLARVLDLLPGRAGIALDNSAPALRRAARAHPRIGAVGCDAWGALPIRAGAAAVALSVFSPRNGPELARVLAGAGTLLVAAPTGRHLAELIQPLGMLRVGAAKEARLARRLEPHFRAADEPRLVEWPLSLGPADLRRLVTMGPSAYHVDADALERAIAALPDPTPATASVEIRALVPLAP